jgi:uncharacterized membrane protein YphA (DoxX/SURF4 family)
MEQSGKLRRLFAAPTAILALRLVVGGVFIYASVDKLAHPDQLAEVIQDYEILPRSLINAAALWLPWVELLAGLLVLTGRWLRPSALVISGLTVVFIGGIALALARGVGLHCGCFSTASGGAPRTWLSLWQEGLLLLGCLWLTGAAFRSGASPEAAEP